MARFRISSKERVIGETELEMHDPGMNVHSGRFYPAQEYEQVRSVFRSLSQALDLSGNEQRDALTNYYAMRTELDLSIQCANRRPLSINWINILDMDEDITSREDLRIEVALNEALDDA